MSQAEGGNIISVDRGMASPYIVTNTKDKEEGVNIDDTDINRELLTSNHGRMQEIIKPKLSETIENILVTNLEVVEGNIAVDTPSPYHINTEVEGDEEAAFNNTEDVVEGGNIAEDVAEGGNISEDVAEGGNIAEDIEEGGNSSEYIAEGSNIAEDIEEGGNIAEDDEEGGNIAEDDEEGDGTVDKEKGDSNIEYDSEMDVEIDLEQIKVEEEEILVCDLCPKVCYGHKELAKHKKHAHLDNKQYTCEECGQCVKGARAFYNHKRRHKKFHCPKCEKHLVIHNKAAHIKKCKGVKNKVKKCEHEGCEFTTDRPSGLKRHMVSHMKVICDVVGCGQEFHGKKKLDAHKRKVHKPIFAPQVCPKQGPKNQPKIHKCQWCSYETRYTSHLKVHLEACRPKKRAESGAGPEEPVSNDELGLLYSLTNKCSMSEFNIILDFFMKKFGRHYFEQGAKSAVSQYANSLDYLHGSEEMIFKVKF